MKDFLKYVLATIVGITILSLITMLIGIGMLFSASSGSGGNIKIEKNSIMELNLDGSLSERSYDNPWDLLTGSASSIGLDEIISSIKKAKDNENIKGIYINCESFGAQPASLEAIRDALVDFKESGKFIIAYADTYTQGLYYLSSVADKMMMNPQGMLEWQGLSAAPMFYKELLDKVGIEMQIFKVGTYKSAVEPFILTEMSDANREQIQDYLGSIWHKMIADVSASRKLSSEQLNAYADSALTYYPAETAVRYGLIDTLIYKSDVNEYLKAMVGKEKDDRLSMYNLSDMMNVKRNVPKDKSGNIIAVYYASGEIDPSTSLFGGTSADNITSDKVVKDLKKLQENEDVKAVVLRVNSPGGSAFGSEQIWYAITQLKETKPVIVSMGDYAASGGYYISSAADTIVAQATTLTGSIGIFGMIPNAKGLTDKLGVRYDVVKTNKHSDLGYENMLARPMDSSEKSMVQLYVNNGYDLFLSRVADGRNKSKAEIDSVGQGRVWTGEKALQLGLVDMLGTLDDAVNLAIDKSGVEHYTVLSYPAKPSMLEALQENNPFSFIRSKILNTKTGKLYQQTELIDNILNSDRIQARLPYEITIR